MRRGGHRKHSLVLAFVIAMWVVGPCLSLWFFLAAVPFAGLDPQLFMIQFAFLACLTLLLHPWKMPKPHREILCGIIGCMLLLTGTAFWLTRPPNTEIPHYPAAQQLKQHVEQPIISPVDGGRARIKFITNDPPESVIRFYREEMLARRWKLSTASHGDLSFIASTCPFQIFELKLSRNEQLQTEAELILTKGPCE